MKQKYVVVWNGEITTEMFDLESALCEAHSFVDQYISDFLRYDLPMKITPEEARRFDVKVFELKDEIELPLQEWVDQYYEDIKEWKEKAEEREYKQFLELYEKFKNRIPGSSND
jgi:hypothetical protein